MFSENQQMLEVLQRIELKLDRLLEYFMEDREDEDLIETTLDSEEAGWDRDERDEL